ncbi:hypothetical protein [Thalassotalea profundi]|uniref:Porin n=1 Tax=Thalassotalea profundi TaxID=2036687 RepID=A0ABQ3J2Y4_9GAMM|nr:hypothetical protein [Thalassotalea profundi]GHF00783.1 hypothetical protein GCM10011501_32810 [Thalassotalea profundi]
MCALAEDAPNTGLNIHGFISQGVIAVDGSDFVSDENNISPELTELGINASYQLSNTLRVAGQAAYLNGGNRFNEGIRIDYLLLNWSVFNNQNWSTNIYLGRFKNFHWLYSSTRDVPMARPSIILPQSVYFDATRDMSVGGDGIAIKTTYSSESFGDLDINLSSGQSPTSREQTRIIMGRFSDGDLTHDNDFQGSFYYSPSYSNWRFGIATTDADFTYQAGENDSFVEGSLALTRYYANAEYQGEAWTLSAEILQEKIALNDVMYTGFYQKSVGQGGYVQSQYRLNGQLQILTRYEHYWANKNDKNGSKLEANSAGTIPHYFGYQRDFTVGLSLDISSHLKLQIEQHWIKGTARLTPVVIPDPTVNKSEYWQISTLQMTYWF